VLFRSNKKRDPWGEFKAAPGFDDPWAEFEPAETDAPAPTPTPSPTPSAAPPLGAPVRAVDGDTLKLDSGTNARLYGVDAPELRQPGFDRNGVRVPIGQQSLDYMEGLNPSTFTLGTVQHESYGRPVLPFARDGEDVGVSMVRSGNAFGAPDYLGNDPEYQFEVMQAERLARLNRLGVHGVQAQSPREFRLDPDWQPNRQQAAQFWDDESPLEGLPPEREREWVELLYNGSVKEQVEFAKANGMTLDLKEVRAWTDWRDKEIAEGRGDAIRAKALYRRGPRALEDGGGGAGGAVVRSAADGFLAGGLDELGAVADTLGGTEGRESVWNSDRRLADIWANNQRQNSAVLGYDSMAHPGWSMAGYLGGAVAQPIGAQARGVAQLGKWGAGYGFAEGFLGTDGNVGTRIKQGAIQTPIGAAGGIVAGKALEAAAPVVRKGWNKLRGRDGESAPADAMPNPDGDEWSEFEELSPSALPMLGEAEPSLSSVPVPRPVERFAPTSRADLMASASSLQPRDVLPVPSNFMEGPADLAARDAGRFAPATAPNEAQALDSTRLRSFYGYEVPKRGPVDMVGWLRLNGGLREDGGELAAMGLTNAARRGMDHVGLEDRFGPLVNDADGMTLDEAAERAWEAGYFPDHAERPSINEFLDAVRGTHDGFDRRFLPEDMDTLARFDAMREERMDLGRMQEASDAPIYADRSFPGDDAAPFAPPEAYEEWGNAAQDFAGNINLAKLDSPQDINRALSQTARQVDMDPARRGRITLAETERLASELNLTPEALLKRRKGQAFNAEEALAARQLLAKSGNELVNFARKVRALDEPGDELLAEFRQKFVRHAAIQEQVAGMTAEAGRALSAFRHVASSRNVRGDVLGALVRAGGGRGNMQDAAEAILDAAEMSPGKFNAFVEKAAKPKWRNKISELYINFLLSNPPTHIVNTVSNGITAIAQIPEYATAAAIGGARRLARGKAAQERVMASEVGQRAIGLIHGAKEGAHLFAKALRTGEADDFASKVEGDEFKAISGLKGEVIRIPTRLLTAEDQFFKGIARRMELGAQASRIAQREGLKGEARAERIAALIANPTDEMFDRALDYGRYLTFQRKLGKIGSHVSGITSESLLAKFIAPFVRTPINLLKFATERSPAAPLLKEWRADYMAGGIRRDLAVAKMLLGTGLGLSIYTAAAEGRLTGGRPPDDAKTRLLYADGWQPYSVKIGDKWVSYSRLDPLSTTIGLAADLATLPDNLSDRQRDDKAMIVTASIMSNLASKTWLSGVSSFVEGLADPGRYAGNWIERLASSFAVPAGVAGVARSIDPVARQRNSIGEAIQARVPGMSDKLLPRRDVFGEPIENGSLGPDFLSPFWESEAKGDPVIGEMLRIGKSVSAPGKQYTEDGERVDYEPEVYDRYHEISGRLVYNGLFDLIASPSYGKMSDTARRKAAKKVIRDARTTARGVLDDPAYRLPAKRGAPPSARPSRGVQGGIDYDAIDVRDGGVSSSPDDWSEFEEAPAGGADEWGEFKEVPQRDVVGSLERSIPGVRITSGYRTPEYQADMRRRGYSPAANSTHLDGSALDLAPPPGKSMGWLAKRVLQLEPKARVLNEGDHLHVTFPDWYGAPAIGGAAAAGLRNPVAASG